MTSELRSIRSDLLRRKAKRDITLIILKAQDEGDELSLLSPPVMWSSEAPSRVCLDEPTIRISGTEKCAKPGHMPHFKAEVFRE